jgi:hypothetical protein
MTTSRYIKGGAQKPLNRAWRDGRSRLINGGGEIAGVVQWQNGSFPSCIRGFDSLRPLQYLAEIRGTVLQDSFILWSLVS